MAEKLFRVEGKVQGVGFRWWTRGLAARLGVTGTVRNLPDGTVEVRARGSDDALARLRAELGNGPPGASVTRVDEEAASGVPTSGFDITH